MRAGQGLAALRAAAAAHLSPAGQLQVATALDMLAATEAQRLEPAAHAADPMPARHLTGAKALAGAAVLGSARSPRLALTCWLAGAGRFSSSRKAVRFAGLDITVLVLRTAKARPGGCPGRGRRCCAGRSMRPARPTPGLRLPTTGYYAAVKDRKNSKRAALSEARKIVRQACHILAELGDDALTAA